jgi:hypothetical protein
MSAHEPSSASWPSANTYSDSEYYSSTDEALATLQPPPDKVTDRYGWQVKAESSISPHEAKLRQKESKVERKRELKWISMLRTMRKKGRWPSRSKMESRVMKGIPDAVRGDAWRYILDRNHVKLSETRPSLDELFNQAVPPHDYVIRVDLPRTMPGVIMFAAERVRNSLYRVLRAYSNYDAELGYFQGFSFLAALFLAYMEETEAFWTFCRLMKGGPHPLRGFYQRDFHHLRRLNIVWRRLLKKKFPKVDKGFTRAGIEEMVYTPSWFLTAFINMNMTPGLRLRLFDRFICFGTRALLSFGLVIVSLHEKKLCKGEMEVIIPILQDPMKDGLFAEWRVVIKMFDKVFLSKDQYRKMFRKANVKYFP